MPTDQGAHRLMLRQAARMLARDAVAAAREAQQGSAAWHFYHGVERAAVHLLQPEMAAVRDDTAWLEAEDPSFRRGFIEANADLVVAMQAAEPPARLRLPTPPRDGRGAEVA